MILRAAVAPGVRLVDTPQLPAALNPLGLAHAEALEICRDEGGTLDRSYLSPRSAQEIERAASLVGPWESRPQHHLPTPSAASDTQWRQS